MRYTTAIIIFVVSLIIATSGCIHSKTIGAIENENQMHSIAPFYTSKVVDISPGCYEIDAKILTPESDFHAYIGAFTYKTTTTDRFGNTEEKWEWAPAPRLDHHDPITQIEKEICSSNRHTICLRRMDIANGYIGTPVSGLRIKVDCKGDCQYNISRCG